MARALRRRVAWVAALLIVVAGGAWVISSPSPNSGQGTDSKSPVGLFTSLPIMWSEGESVSAMLSSPGSIHWAREVMERHGRLVALDTLLDLSHTRRLVIAQPRPLAPEENIALDKWVRAGGKVLLFADPMLTQESAFALGDHRRPQDVVLLSPILSRWGIELRFDESQAAGLRESAGEGLPVNLPGQLAVIPGGVDSRCQTGAESLIARCKIGQGQVLIVADAAVLEAEGDIGARSVQLDALLDQAFAR